MGVHSELELALTRLVDRLRRIALTRLEADFAPEPTRVAAARTYAQRLADAAAALEEPDRPTWRDVPAIGASAAGDLVAVTGHDVLLAACGRDRTDRLPLRGGGQVELGVLLDELARVATELRVRL